VDNAPRVLDALGAGGARWLLFWAAVGAVVFVYLHTDIRHTLGSARQGRLNYRTLYTVWLVAAVLYHVPTLSALGIDIRSDVSLLLTVFIVTFALSGAVEGLRQLLVAVGAYPASYQVLPKGASWKSVATVLVVNSAIAAFACSSFYSFCGEHAALHGPASWASGSTLVGKFALGLRSASKSVICDTMVHRVGVPEEYPAFSGLLLYSDPSPGGGVGPNDTCTGVEGGGCHGEESTGPSGEAGTPQIAPVLVLWISLVMMGIVNHIADVAVAGTMEEPAEVDVRISGTFGKHGRSYSFSFFPNPASKVPGNEAAPAVDDAWGPNKLMRDTIVEEDTAEEGVAGAEAPGTTEVMSTGSDAGPPADDPGLGSAFRSPSTKRRVSRRPSLKKAHATGAVPAGDAADVSDLEDDLESSDHELLHRIKREAPMLDLTRLGGVRKETLSPWQGVWQESPPLSASPSASSSFISRAGSPTILGLSPKARTSTAPM